MEKENPGIVDIVDKTCFLQKNFHDLIYLYCLQNMMDPGGNKNARFIFIEFTEQYIKTLENLMYCNWYVSCFSTNSENPALWGYYRDCHKGACLKFKTKSDSPGFPTIKLTSIVGLSWSGKNSKLDYGKITQQFYPVKYSNKHPEIDFFCSLGALPVPVLYENWYLNEHKGISDCAKNMMTENQEKWRKEYWQNLYGALTIKLEHWRHEEEYRLLLTPLPGGINFSDSRRRKQKYDFKDLEAIIFGIKTSREHKIKIMQIIYKKCKREGRRNFKFYQKIEPCWT